jgi:hypothetical protein
VAVAVAVPVFDGVAVPDGLLAVAEGVAFVLLVALADASADGLAVVVGEAEPDEAGFLVAVAELDGVAVGLLLPLWVSVLVLAGVVLAPGLFDRVRVAAELPVEEAEGVVDGVVVVGVGVVGVGVGVGVCVAVCVGVGVGVGVETKRAWHDSSLTEAAVTAE